MRQSTAFQEGSSRSAWRIAAVAGVVALGIVTAGAAVQALGDQTEGSPSEAYALFSEQAQQGVPVVVPRELPAGYAFWGMPGIQIKGDGEVLSARWLYRSPTGPDALPVVELCVERPTVDPCGQDAVLVREVNGVRVKINSMGPGPRGVVRERWSDVEFTADWPSVDWVQLGATD